MKCLMTLALLLAGCASPPHCVMGSPAVVVQLLFGRALKGGGGVDDAAWQAFLAREVTTRFPDGLTVLEGSGQWRPRDGLRVISEPSTVVAIVTEPSAGTFAKIEAIRDEYRHAFNQDSVGLVVNDACAAF